jgi:RNA polymerase sigma factor for flagellar operon FliA
MPKTEEELWREYKRTKNLKVREELILRYASVVKYIAGRIAINTPPQVEFDDLVSYGILGLIDAIEKYDPNQGIRFKTYATSRIKGAIIDELRVLDWIPRSLRQKAKQLEKTYAELEYKYGRSATDKEVAEALEITEDELSKLILDVSGASLISLDDVWYLDNDEEIGVIDTIESPPEQGPEAEVEKKEMRQFLIEAINRLPEREKEVIILYYYDGLTLKEIGSVIGVTESRISQLHTKAIFRLKGYLSKMRELFV